MNHASSVDSPPRRVALFPYVGCEEALRREKSNALRRMEAQLARARAVALGERRASLSRSTISAIRIAVAEAYGVRVFDILSARRTANVIEPRQVAMYLSREVTLRSLPEIGRMFGHRDHTTILHAVRKIAARIAIDPGFADRVAAIRASIEGDITHV